MCVIVIYAGRSGDPPGPECGKLELYCTAQLNNKTSANACGHLLPLVKLFKPFFFQRFDTDKTYNGRLSAQSAASLHIPLENLATSNFTPTRLAERTSQHEHDIYSLALSEELLRGYSYCCTGTGRGHYGQRSSCSGEAGNGRTQ
jgi:hypothetical protein